MFWWQSLYNYSRKFWCPEIWAFSHIKSVRFEISSFHYSELLVCSYTCIRLHVAGLKLGKLQRHKPENRLYIMFSSYTMYYNFFYTVIFLQFTTNHYTHLKTTSFTLMMSQYLYTKTLPKCVFFKTSFCISPNFLLW